MSFFSILWRNYPDNDPCNAKNNKGEVLFKNQCAIRLSYSLTQSGVPLSAFPSSRKCWVHKSENEVLAAKELADWLNNNVHSKIKSSVDVTGEDWREKVINRKGIICFEDYYQAANGSGGDHVPGFWSDFRKSKRIRFYEVV